MLIEEKSKKAILNFMREAANDYNNLKANHAALGKEVSVWSNPPTKKIVWKPSKKYR
ncbi:MAG: hypothetical protein ACI4OA_08815 [Selenomonadaceae bacterium]